MHDRPWRFIVNWQTRPADALESRHLVTEEACAM